MFTKKTRSNVFLTITSSKGKVITIVTFGQIKIKSKKRRRSNESFFSLCKEMRRKLKKILFNKKRHYKKLRLGIYFTRNLHWYYRKTILRYLYKGKIKLFKQILLRTKAHNGITKKKVRRRGGKKK